jgi:zinc protease
VHPRPNISPVGATGPGRRDCPVRAHRRVLPDWPVRRDRPDLRVRPNRPGHSTRRVRSLGSLSAPFAGALAFALALAAGAAAAPPAPGAHAESAAPAGPAAPAGHPASAAARHRAIAAVFPYKVERQVLANGLEVLVIPYDSPGTVAYYTVVRTGSRDEVEAGHSGFAHFFEHMMFRGTDRYPAAKYNDVVKSLGGDSNASTFDDVTVYHIVGPVSRLETIMDMEADRFQNLKYSEDDFRTEALAVLGEYNKNASSPNLPMFEKLRDLAYEKHTYKHTTIGFVADIKAMPGYYAYSRQFFDRFYRPENSTLLVVGDVKPAQVFALARRFYGGWQRGYKPPAIEAEPPQTVAKKAHIDWPNPVRPQLLIAYPIPAFSTSGTDSAALEVVGELLFAESAPLFRDLVVDKQWVDFIQGGPNQHRDPGQFTIFARVKSEELVPKVLAALDDAIAGLQTRAVDPGRLARIKSFLRYEFALGLRTPGRVAAQAATYIGLTGNVESINQAFAADERVAPADIQRVARAYFRPQGQTLVTLSHPVAPASPAAEGKPSPGGKPSQGESSHD